MRGHSTRPQPAAGGALARRRLTAAVAVLAAGAALTMRSAGSSPGQDVGGGGDGPFAVGRDLALDGSAQQVMQPEHVSADVATVAVVPGSSEAWAVGVTHAPDPGGAGVAIGRTVMMHRRAGGSAWEVEGAPRGAPYAPFNRPDPVTGELPPANPGLAALALLPSGEGWAVSKAGFGPAGMYHHAPGSGPWVWWDPASAASRGASLPNNGMLALSLWAGSPVGGEAVGPAGELVHLGADGIWRVDPTPDPRVAFTSVSMVGPDEAWAVGRRSPVFDANALANPATAEAELARYLATHGDSRPLVYHRTGGAWSPETVPPVGLPALSASPAFNQPSPSMALGVAADPEQLWIVGATVTQAQSANAAGAASGGQLVSSQATEPYAARRSADGSWRSYCATSGQTVSCDEPFPSGDGLLSDAALVCCQAHRTELFTGGLTNGFYRATTTGLGSIEWTNLPATVQPVTAIALSSPEEGYVASNGAALGTGIVGEFAFSQPLLGHWTRSPLTPSMRRWPQLNTLPYAAVAADPSGSGRALAVGRGGIIGLVDGSGWHRLPSPTAVDLNAVTWSRPNEAWAVGDRGTILHFDGRAWSADPSSGRLAGTSLRGISMPGAVPSGPAPRPVAAPPGSGGTGTAAAGVLAWGRDDSCQLVAPPAAGCSSSGHASFADESIGPPVAVPFDRRPCSSGPGPAPRQVSRLSAAGNHSLAVVGGQVWEWGSSLTYQPSGNACAQANGPIRVDFGDPAVRITEVAAGAGYSLALAADGTLYSWGSNGSGVLGIGDPTPAAQLLPVRVRMPASAGPVTAIAAGLNHALAVAGGGQVYTWGQDPAVPEEPVVSNQVPGGRVTTLHPLPQPVPGLSGAIAVAAAERLSAAVIARPGGNEVDTWGQSCSGELGYPFPRAPTDPCPRNPSPRAVSFPAPAPTDVQELSAGAGFVLARTGGGQVYGWGQNGSHQVAQNPPPAATDPVSGNVITPVYLGGLPAVDRVAAGDGHSLALANGSVYAWGDDLYSELGHPPSCNQAACGLPADCLVQGGDPPTSCGVPQLVSGLTGAVAVAAGSSFSEAPGAYNPPGTSSGSGSGGGSTSASAPPADGYAVGDSGTILAHDAAGWRLHPASGSITSRSLTAVTATNLDFVAVGDEGTVLSSDGSVWFPALRREGLDDQLRVGGAAPRLGALASFPDGTVYVGGERGTLLERPAGGRPGFGVSRLPGLEGVIRSLAFQRRPDGSLRGLASVGGHESPQGYGWLMAYDGSPARWRDIEFGWAHSIDLNLTVNADTAVLRDAATAVVLDGGSAGSTGWAVGGAPDIGDAFGASDLENHNTRPTSSIWRVDLDSPPGDPPGVISGAPLGSPQDGVSFAFLGNTGCLSGYCSTLLGSGSHGDSVAVEALRAIQAAAAQGGVAFTVSGGDMRSRGDPASLRQFAHLLGSTGLPVFGALGARDLQVDPSSGAGTSGPWKTAFAGAPAPWGGAPVPAGFRSVNLSAAPRQPGQAATHYAVDYAPAGSPLLRLVVLDTSATPVSGRAAEQNPQEDQVSWLAAVLHDAASRAIPPVVVMNRPVMPPAAVRGSEDGGITAVLAGSGLAGALAAEPAMNQLRTSLGGPRGTGAYPIGVFGGGGGSPVSFPAGPGAGGYHSWQLVTLEGQGITVRSIPILESVALGLSATSVGVGDPIAASGLGRLVDSGTSAFTSGAGPLQNVVSTLPFPYPIPCGADHPGGGGRAGCRRPEVAPPDYHFLSEQGHLVPVREDPDNPGRPLLHAGRATVDDSSGILCGVSPGDDVVDLISGAAGARLPVSVAAGSSVACGTLPPAPPVRPSPSRPPAPASAPKQPAPQHEPPPAKPSAPGPQPRAPGPVPPPLQAVAVPHRHQVIARPLGVPGVPALPEVIPAPPGGLSALPAQVPDEMSVPEREEEEAAATVESDASFVRAHHGPRRQPTWQLAAAEVAGAALAAWLLAVPAARRRRQLLSGRAAEVASTLD